jgi:hypothetical protein
MSRGKQQKTRSAKPQMIEIREIRAFRRRRRRRQAVGNERKQGRKPR